MSENGDDRAAAIDRYWDAITRGEQPADDIDRSLAETIVQMHERNDAPEPDPVFVARLEHDLAAATYPQSFNVRTSLGGAAPSPNGTASTHALPPPTSLRTIPLSRSTSATSAGTAVRAAAMKSALSNR